MPGCLGKNVNSLCVQMKKFRSDDLFLVFTSPNYLVFMHPLAQIAGYPTLRWLS